METESRCIGCGSNEPAVGPSLWKFALIGAVWAPLLLLGICSAIMLPLNLVLVPCWFMVASSVGPLARTVLDARCPRCHASRGPSSSAPALRRSPRPEGASVELGAASCAMEK